MMQNGFSARLWEDRWRIFAWVLPAVLLVVFADRAGLPLAARLRSVNAQLESLRENTYVPAWLDSTREALRADVDALKAFQVSREGALNRDSSAQTTVDGIRRLAQAAGMEVVKTTPILARADSLQLLKVRIDGFSRYPGLVALFASLKNNHPDMFTEELLLRQGGERADGRLEAQLTIYVYDRPRDMAR
jgi:Type II secretion system (T2SS), protein M subtype b